MKVNIKSLIFKHNYTLCLLITSIFIQTIISSLFPYITKFIIDDVLINHMIGSLKKIIIFSIILVLIQITINVIVSYLCSKWTQLIILDLREKISDSFFANKESPQKNGLFINSIINDCEVIGNKVLAILANGLPNILLIIMYIIILVSLNKMLFAIILLTLPLFLIIAFITSNKMYTLSKTLQSQKDKLLDYLNNHVRNKILIHLYDLKHEEKLAFNSITNQLKDINIKSNTILSLLGNISGLISVIVPLITLLIGSYLAINNKLSIGSLIVFNSYTALLFNPISNIISIPANYSQLKASIERIETNTFYEKYKINSVNIHSSEIKDCQISINNFIPYNKNIPLFNSPLSINIYKGEWWHIVGKNGSGKSILLQSIVNFYENYSGSISIGEKLNISYIPQENFLFDGNILQNLTKGIKNYDNNRLKVLIKLFNFNVPLNQQVKSFTLKLSSGELQKIKLIRSLLKKPDIILLDEIFANMDKETTTTLIEYLKEQNITTLFIYHGNLTQIISHNEYNILDLNKLSI